MKTAKIIYFSICFLFLFSCSSISNKELKNNEQNITKLSKDIQNYLFMPSNTEVIMNESVVIGKDDKWVGKLTLISNNEVETVYSFIREKYIKNNWELKTTYQSENAFLVFEKSKKLITVDISIYGLIKNKVKIIFTLSDL